MLQRTRKSKNACKSYAFGITAPQFRSIRTTNNSYTQRIKPVLSCLVYRFTSITVIDHMKPYAGSDLTGKAGEHPGHWFAVMGKI
jgi:hypothetical protein